MTEPLSWQEPPARLTELQDIVRWWLRTYFLPSTDAGHCIPAAALYSTWLTFTEAVKTVPVVTSSRFGNAAKLEAPAVRTHSTDAGVRMNGTTGYPLQARPGVQISGWRGTNVHQMYNDMVSQMPTRTLEWMTFERSRRVDVADMVDVLRRRGFAPTRDEARQVANLLLPAREDRLVTVDIRELKEYRAVARFTERRFSDMMRLMGNVARVSGRARVLLEQTDEAVPNLPSLRTAQQKADSADDPA